MKYTEEHEWLRADGDHVIVGVTQYAADQMGDHAEADGKNSDQVNLACDSRPLTLIF